MKARQTMERNLQRTMRAMNAAHNPLDSDHAAVTALVMMGILDGIIQRRSLPVDEQRAFVHASAPALNGLADKLRKWAQ